MKTIGQLTNLNIHFVSSKSFTNFNVTTFRTSIRSVPVDAKLDAKTAEPHLVNIYRYWAYDEKEQQNSGGGGSVPSESPFYLKMIRLINKNNPTTLKNGPKTSANYLFHSL